MRREISAFQVWPWKVSRFLFRPFIERFYFFFRSLRLSIEGEKFCESFKEGGKIFIENLFFFTLALFFHKLEMIYVHAIYRARSLERIKSWWYTSEQPVSTFSLLVDLFPHLFSLFFTFFLSLNCSWKYAAKQKKSSKFINFIPLYFYACEHVTFSIMTSFIIGLLKWCRCSEGL